MERDTYRRARWTVLGISLVVCLLSYTHLVPLVFGEAASCMIPLIWAVDAYRDEKRLMFFPFSEDGQGLIYTRPAVAIAPGLAIVVTVLAINILGDGLRDALDVRETSRRSQV